MIIKADVANVQNVNFIDLDCVKIALVLYAL